MDKVLTNEEREMERTRQELEEKLRPMSPREAERYLISIGHLCEHGYGCQSDDDGHDYEWDE